MCNPNTLITSELSWFYRANDIITSVNGVNTVDVSHEEAVGALKQAGNRVQLVSVHSLFEKSLPKKLSEKL